MKKTKLKGSHSVISWILQLIIVVVLAYAAYLKLSCHELEIALFTVLQMEPLGRYTIGFLEAVACVLLILPNATVHGAVLSFGLMVGAIIAHCTKIGFEGATPIMAIMVMVFSVIIIYLRRKQIPSIARMMGQG